jgi:hypothetical protein
MPTYGPVVDRADGLRPTKGHRGVGHSAELAYLGCQSGVQGECQLGFLGQGEYRSAD